MKVQDFEIFKFSENKFTEFKNNGNIYRLNKNPYLDIVLTDRCNQNCGFCIADLIHEKLDCDINIFKEKIIYAIKNMNVREVLLLGGEPTVSKQLIPMIKWLSTLSLDKIVMTTNGVKFNNEEYTKKVLSSGLTHINISVMSFCQDTQIDTFGKKSKVTIETLKVIKKHADKHGVKVRINNNIYKGNNDWVEGIIDFYETVKPYCHSVKFSPLLPVDDFSVINIKTEWVKKHILSPERVYELFTWLQKHYEECYEVSTIENDLQFGFVKNTMIPLKTPIVFNWNFGKYTGMMDKVVNHNQINNIKLLPNGELSLSWNREREEYYIKTD